MGLDLIHSQKIEELVVPSPFDFEKQSKVLIASFLPLPSDKKYFPLQSLTLLKNVIKSADKGTMVLFTSYADLNFIYDALSDEMANSNIPLLAQGKSGSRSNILREFKEHGKSVLLGTNSFWEGIDIKGDSLSLLVIYKLPFSVPSEPIVEAYIEKLEQEGKDSFNHYMLPTALLKFKQGFGRLIRSTSDSGIVIVLDNRMHKKQYGQYFKSILPVRSENVDSEAVLMNQVSRWFSKV